MARWHILLAAAATAASTMVATPAHAACQVQIMNSPPSGAFVQCFSPATQWAMQSAQGAVYYYVTCNGVQVIPTTYAPAPSFAQGPFPGGCFNAGITLRAAMPGSTAFGWLT